MSIKHSLYTHTLLSLIIQNKLKQLNVASMFPKVVVIKDVLIKTALYSNAHYETKYFWADSYSNQHVAQQDQTMSIRRFRAWEINLHSCTHIKHERGGQMLVMLANWGSRRREKVLAGEETPPTPKGFNLATSSSARFALTTGTADATFAQAGKRARPVMYG